MNKVSGHRYSILTVHWFKIKTMHKSQNPVKINIPMYGQIDSNNKIILSINEMLQLNITTQAA